VRIYQTSGNWQGRLVIASIISLLTSRGDGAEQQSLYCLQRFCSERELETTQEFLLPAEPEMPGSPIQTLAVQGQPKDDEMYFANGFLLKLTVSGGILRQRQEDLAIGSG
jgi:hypothetical protein